MEIKPKKIEQNKIPEIIKEKWGGDVLDEGFVPVPKRFVRGMHKLFEGEAVEQLSIIFAIADYKRKEPYRYPSIEYLAILSGLSLERFKKVMKILSEKKLITINGTEESLNINIDPLVSIILEKTRMEEE